MEKTGRKKLLSLVDKVEKRKKKCFLSNTTKHIRRKISKNLHYVKVDQNEIFISKSLFCAAGWLWG
jgi:hypothetical protein